MAYMTGTSRHPAWGKGVYTADVVAVLLALAGRLLIRSYRKKKKTENK